jgi:hypothetical protein
VDEHEPDGQRERLPLDGSGPPGAGVRGRQTFDL